MKARFYIIGIFLGLATLASSFSDESVLEGVNAGEHFGLGEKYKYKIKYGFIPIGQANVDVNSRVHTIDNTPCYRINVLGRTTGFTDVFKVRNTYRSFVDTSSILPKKFILSAREGSYKRDQEFIFKHKEKKVIRIEKGEENAFNVPKNVLDVISGYYYLRTLDYKNLKLGSYTSAPLFFHDKVYQMKVKYAGKDKVKTKFGTIDVLKLHPILPKNDLFEGEEAIRIWVSDDKNHVPIRIEVDFSIAAVNMELIEYSNTLHEFTWK